MTPALDFGAAVLVYYLRLRAGDRKAVVVPTDGRRAAKQGRNEKMKNVVTAIRVCVAMLAPLGAWADTWTDGSGNAWTYTINGEEATVNTVSFETTTLVIPDTLGDKPVTAFDAGVFAGKARAVRVTIPATVTAIPAEAFLNCGNLKAVTINGEGLTSIGARAFRGCGNLEAFVMPNSVSSLGQGAFAGCSSMVSVTLSDALTELPGVPYRPGYTTGYGDDEESGRVSMWNHLPALFDSCASLETINWGANVKSIGNVAFLNCSALESVEIPDTVTNIGYHAFLGCSSLANVKIGDGVTSIGRMAFRALPNLTKVTFGEKVDEIGQQAFQDCVNLQNFTLPDTIQNLCYRCFAGCSKALTEVTIPTNKDEMETKLQEAVFAGCSKLATVTFGDTVKTLTGVPYAPGYTTSYGDAAENTTLYMRYSDGLFYNCTSLETINWGVGIKSIGNIAFLNCSALESVEIPNTVTNIGNHAFLGCSSLANVKIGDGVTSIGRMAFRALPNLTKVTFGEKVDEIGQQAFQDCVNLQNFTLPDTIQNLCYRCFAGCSKALTEVTIPTNKDEMETKLQEAVFAGCSKLATVTFGDTVKTLTGVSYAPGYTTSYGDTAEGTTLYMRYYDGLFYNCTSLKTINWGAGIKSIGNIAFLNCSALTDLVIPAGITDIGNHAFFGCSSLKVVTVMGNVNSLGRYAFGNCPALHYVDFRGAKMTSAPGYMPFKFDNDRVTVYAAEGSTGWKGVAEVEGLPDDGTWGGARITYAPPPENADAPYDFYVYPATATISRVNHYWSLMVTTNRYVHGKTVPQSVARIYEGDPVYLSYAFNEYWRGEAFSVVNRITLSGAKSGSVDDVFHWNAHATAAYGWTTNAAPALLQKLPKGSYTLTLQLNGDNSLDETDYSNNTTSIAFKVVAATHTVTFNGNGGSSEAASRKVKDGAAVGKLPAAKKSGYIFDGWYTAKTGGRKIAASTTVLDDMTVYARWAAAWTVTWNANGGKIGSATTSKVLVRKGAAVGTLPKATRKGYAFKGWYTAKSGGTKAKTTTKITKSVTYYAQWTANKYTIKFNKNGGKGTMKTQSATYGKNVTLRANAFTKAKYKFAGWATKKNGKVAYKNKAKVKNLTDKDGKTVTLYAVWNKAKSGDVKAAAKPAASAARPAAAVAVVPAWAVGTFYGGDEGAFTTITVSKAGKVSGKVLFEDGGRWTIVGKAAGQRLETVVTDAGGNSAEVVFAIGKTPDGRCRIESEDGSISAEN